MATRPYMRTAGAIILAAITMLAAGALAPAQASARARYGCGPGNLTFVPQRLGRASFVAACTRHDMCYGSKGPGGRPYARLWCDQRFLKDLRLACTVARAGIACRAAAWSYYQAVRRFGLFSYLVAQRHAVQRTLRW